MRVLLYLIVFALPLGRSFCQAVRREFSSIQFVNAASTARLRLQVGDKVWYSTFEQGQKTSAGAFSQINWPLCILASDEGTQIESQFDAHSGKSYTAVILGDFRIDPEQLSGTAATSWANSKTEKVRAKIVFLPNAIDPRKGHRLRVVNGLVDTAIHFSIPGGDRIRAEFGEAHTLTGLPAATALQVEAADRIFNLSFLFVPPERGCTVAFYRKKNQISYVAANEVVLNPDGSLPSASEEEIGRILKRFDASVP